MNWNVDGEPIAPEWLGELAPVETLYEFDGPRIYVARVQNRPVIVYESDADDERAVRRLLVAPTNEKILDALKAGARSLLEALNQPWLHAVDQAFDHRVVAAWHLPKGLSSVPEPFKPVAGTLLSVELEQERRSNEPDSPSRAGFAPGVAVLQLYINTETIEKIPEAANKAPSPGKTEAPNPWPPHGSDTESSPPFH
jgi:hypothetical protein